jgi:AcrR family transcriptional regulator
MSTDTPTGTYATQRAAAARNHTAILDVAHDLLTQSPTASMNEIAKRAGVGAGTLYRHFPTREALVLAVYRHDVHKLVASADDALAAQAPLDAFVTWFETLAHYIRLKHGLGDALHNAAIQDAINQTYAPVLAAVTKLLDACVADGSVRDGIDPADILLLMGFMWRVSPDQHGVEQRHRLVQIVFDGIRRHPDRPSA